MAINDHISNLLARIRNAQMARFDQLELPSTRVLENIASILKEEGVLKNYRVLPDPKQTVLRAGSSPGPFPIPEMVPLPGKP